MASAEDLRAAMIAFKGASGVRKLHCHADSAGNLAYFLLSACDRVGLASPKGTLDGSQVAPTYARGDIEAIAAYNRGDVLATVGVYQRVRDTLLRFRPDW